MVGEFYVEGKQEKTNLQEVLDLLELHANAYFLRGL